MSKLKVQDFAERVAADLLDMSHEDVVQQCAHYGVREYGNAVVWVEIIIQILEMISEECPVDSARLAKRMKSPSLFQRVRFRTVAWRACRCSDLSDAEDNVSGVVQAIYRQSEDMPEDDIVATMSELRDPDNRLV